MTGSMYAAIAGLKTHMQNLNVIGNNIANVNTYAYKAQSTVFRSALYTSLSGGSNGTSTTGGLNPSQIGYGANMGSVDIDMSTGTYALTGRNLDCMIDGSGFFLFGDKTVANSIDPNDPDTFKSLTLGRVGRFDFGPDSYLTDDQGNVVYGFLCVGKDADGNAVLSDQLVPMRLPKMMTDADGAIKVVYPVPDKDTGRLADVTSVTTAQDGTITYNTGEEKDTLDFAALDSISIDGATGKITGTTTDNQIITIGYIAMGTVTNPNGVTMESDSYYSCGEGAGNLSITMMGGAAQDVIVTKSLTETDYSKYTFDSEALSATGTTLVDASTALRKGMEYVNGYWAVAKTNGAAEDTTNNTITGLNERSKVNNGGQLKLVPGGLESSKTDLATEIAGMITTQRGYQANTKIVTVTDEMLETLVNMKR